MVWGERPHRFEPRLHPLKGDLRGAWAVTVRANWRIVWRFEAGDAAEVDLTDYHQENERCR